MKNTTFVAAATLLASAFLAQPVMAQDADAEKLAKQLSNPIASLINVPFQLNYDSNLGRWKTATSSN